MMMFHFLLMLLFFDNSIGEMCHKCQVNLEVNLTSQQPQCNRTNITNCLNTTICGSVLQIKNNSVDYLETCLNSQICANTSAISNCPKESCYIFCCQEDLCNKFNLSNIEPHIPVEVLKLLSKSNKTTSYQTSPKLVKVSSPTTPVPTCGSNRLCLMETIFIMTFSWVALS